MMRDLLSSARAFWQREDGTAVVPFALWTPLFVSVILSGVELAVLTARHTSLEQALDQTVRDVRLGTGTLYTHDSLKQSICDRATILPDCEGKLQLEMVELDMRDWTDPPSEVACVDTSGTAQPVVSFEYGRDNQLMYLRACYLFDPIAPTSSFSEALVKDANGYSAIVSTAAFVHEPS
ncbi:MULTISPECIES: TadE/TadG family type IV pilus assembly protein [unclassified Roseivivax]|uniref:TadE/TadG family type IV pilus assembly protein n=1 Tax=Roseivivax sp. GX 12232 TaxID=2900547 RepID=UPI001E644295|nr:TadE/TadG family type IV pilus assembly protein [Roseivivax sp. GX 12232]MCE0506841.1 pilus assembly protein [Roseivivax sp. GX 12232]